MDIEQTILVELRQLRCEVRQLRTAVDSRSPPIPRRFDHLAEHLGVVHAAVAGTVFTTKELSAHAKLPEASGLRAALDAVADANSPRKIGNLFTKIEGVEIGGLSVLRIDECNEGVIWAFAVSRV